MIAHASLPFIVEPMVGADIDEVMVLERQAFASAPWSASAYRHELSRNEMAHYFVLRERHEPLPAGPRRGKRALWKKLIAPYAAPQVAPALPPILAYGGFWLMADDAHISTIATAPAWRRKYLGELLLVALIEEAQAFGALRVTLEVRVSNTAAQTLYRKYRFDESGLQRRYYSDNGEDALKMSTDRIDRPDFQRAFDERKRLLWEKLGASSGDFSR
jgi:[ribosomal protein S18]-alanine N-acetyltransferase